MFPLFLIFRKTDATFTSWTQLIVSVAIVAALIGGTLLAYNLINPY